MGLIEKAYSVAKWVGGVGARIHSSVKYLTHSTPNESGPYAATARKPGGDRGCN